MNNPSNAEIQFQAGVYFFDLKKHLDALPYFLKVREIDLAFRKNDTLEYIGDIYFEDKDYELE